MVKLVNRVKAYAEGSPILFGDGANSGLFGRVRGAGVKGSVLEIKERLSKEMPVIECSEFRTSKLCLDCGREAKFYNYGVASCQERTPHQRMTNRDAAAARKIGARYLAMKKELDVGPCCRGVSAEEVKRGTHASTVLKRVLTSYANGTYFSETFADTPSYASPRPMKAEHLLFGGSPYITLNAHDYDIHTNNNNTKNNGGLT